MADLASFTDAQFELVEQVILSEQIDAARAVRLMQERPDFASWYNERRKGRAVE